MTEADRRALYRLVGADESPRASTDDLQGLLLQVVFALLMVFMIAYFIFVESARKEHQEEVLELNRQKLVLALEKTAEDHRIRYGLNALMTQGTDGQRSFDADSHVKHGRLELSPAAKSAFATGSAAAFADYGAVDSLRSTWRTNVLEAAELAWGDLKGEEREWLDGEIARRVEEVRLDARGVQRALAARLQQGLIAHPESLADVQDAGILAERLKAQSLEMIKAESGAEVLP